MPLGPSISPIFSRNVMRNACSLKTYDSQAGTSLWNDFHGGFTAQICIPVDLINPTPELKIQWNEKKWKRNIRNLSNCVDDLTSAVTAVLSGSPALFFFLPISRRANSAGTTYFYLAEYHWKSTSCTLSVSVSGTFRWHFSKGTAPFNNNCFGHLCAL